MVFIQAGLCCLHLEEQQRSTCSILLLRKLWQGAKGKSEKAELMSADSRMSLKLKGEKASFRIFQCHQTWGVKCTTHGGSQWFELTFLKENSLERRCKGCGGSANELLRSRIYWSSQSSLSDQQEDEESRETTTVNY